MTQLRKRAGILWRSMQMPALPGCLCGMLLLASSQAVAVAGSTATNTRVGSAVERTYESAWDYCKAVVSHANVTQQHWGPNPAGRKRFLRVVRSKFLSEDAPEEILVNGLSVRCMAGDVWACHVGANLPCQEKADTRRTPTAPVRDFCRDNPNAQVIPMVVSGRATIFQWTCKAATPVIKRAVSKVDRDGYIADIWVRLERP